MKRVALIVPFVAAVLQAQTAPGPASVDAGASGSIPTLRTSTQLVVLDVLVADSKGRPVHGLGRANFLVEEDKTPQTLRTFDEHSPADQPHPGPPAPQLPPGTFTNYTPAPPTGTLNVLLLDALNTSRNDQSYLRTQLQKYMQAAAPGQTTAIFGLNSRLYLLQGLRPTTPCCSEPSR